MEQMGVRLQTLPIGGLERAQFLRLTFASVDRKRFVNEKIPDFFATFPGVRCYILSVTHAAELRVGRGWLGAVAIANDLQHAFALVDLLTQHRAQVARLSAEDILPDRLVAEKGEGVGGELAAAAQFAADGGDEHERKRSHGNCRSKIVPQRRTTVAYSLAMRQSARYDGHKEQARMF